MGLKVLRFECPPLYDFFYGSFQKHVSSEEESSQQLQHISTETYLSKNEKYYIIEYNFREIDVIRELLSVRAKDETQLSLLW